MEELEIPNSLMDEHMLWHDQVVPPYRKGTRLGSAGDPGSGLDFLEFHYGFVNRVNRWYSPTPAPYLPSWYQIPNQLKVGSVDPDDGEDWAWYAGIEQRIVNDPLSFMSADELGIYIETGNSSNPRYSSANSIHIYVHMKSFWVYGDSNMPNISMSPRSPLFYKFHLLISSW